MKVEFNIEHSDISEDNYEHPYCDDEEYRLKLDDCRKSVITSVMNSKKIMSWSTFEKKSRIKNTKKCFFRDLDKEATKQSIPDRLIIIRDYLSYLT